MMLTNDSQDALLQGDNINIGIDEYDSFQSGTSGGGGG